MAFKDQIVNKSTIVSIFDRHDSLWDMIQLIDKQWLEGKVKKTKKHYVVCKFTMLKVDQI